jgi:hypothetical protein
MDNMLELRPSTVETDRLTAQPSSRKYARTYTPSVGPAQLSSLDIAAGVLMAVMMIGPLAAAAIGRMMS